MILVSSLLISVGNHAFAQIAEAEEFLNPIVILETNLGEITIEFFYIDAPNHVDNFIQLSNSGFYDGTIFHRIIPGFMIQGGDPNTTIDAPSTWGLGGPEERVDAEFNTIKHNRGIVSMARSADPNSAGSQFFIVHQNSNFLDGEYTAFGRIVTEESFETLDKIAAVQTGDKDIPIDTEQVKITKATIASRSEVSNLLELPEPERTQSTITTSTGNQKFESAEEEIVFTVPEGWLLQQPDKTQENSPDFVAVGPKIGVINPVFSLTIQQTNQRTLDDLITEKNESLKQFIESEDLNIISQGKTIIGANQAHVIDAEGVFVSDGKNLDMKFREVLIYDTEKFYTFSYSNDINEFEKQLPRFIETINSFETPLEYTSINETITNESEGKWVVADEEYVESLEAQIVKLQAQIIELQTQTIDDDISQDIESLEAQIVKLQAQIDSINSSGGGCLIATATFGSELAPQVQQLRELRDNIILSTESGSAFMTGFNQFYYSFSPTIADLERESPIFKEAMKLTLTPMLSSLSLLNHVDIDSEEEMLGYGASLIILNIGMYFVAPATIIYKIKKQIIK